MLQHGGRLAGKGPGGGVQGAKVAGRRIEIVEGCSETGVYGRLINETRQLVEVDHVDAVVGGFGWSDGIVFRELARRYPTVPFLLVVSAVREATAHRPAANLYRFVPDIEQGTAGLATYAYRTLGWRHAAVVAEYTSNGWGGASAFTREFCALGGTTEQIWTTELGYGPAKPLLKQVPASADGLVVLSAYGSFGTPVPFIRGWVAQHADAPRSLLLALWMFPPLDTAPFASLWPDVHGVVARLAGIPVESSPSDAAYRKAFAAGISRLAAERREQPRRAAVLDCGASAAAVSREDSRSARRGARRLARRARLASGSTRRGAACASTAIARPSCR